MSTTYEELLRDPRWQRKRLEKMSEVGWACEICGDKEEELHIHHPSYQKWAGRFVARTLGIRQQKPAVSLQDLP
jgi:hypothetical protein